MRIATAEQMRTLDRRAIEERGVPSLELMERAANALAEAAIDTAANAPGRAVCFCGPGNNGGDGVACARLLLEAGFEVRCILVGQREKLTCDTRAMEARLAAAGGVLEPFTPDEARLYGGLHLEGDPLYGDYLEAQLHRLRRRLDGLRHSREGADCGTLPQLIAALEKKKEALK